MRPGRSKIAAFLVGFCLSLSTGEVAAVKIAQSPLFVSNTADPNILFILDDSGSMRWGFSPDELVDDISVDVPDGGLIVTNDASVYADECPGDGSYAGVDTCFFAVEGNHAAASHTTNPIYYNPDNVYAPPFKGDGTGDRYPDSQYTDAWLDGYDSANTETMKVNLSDDYRAIMDPYYRLVAYCDGGVVVQTDGRYSCIGGSFRLHYGFAIGSKTNNTNDKSGDSAFYYNFIGGDGCTAKPIPDSCFSTIINPSTDAEKKNFANWFSYYRNRQLLSRAGVSSAFIDQSENMRLGYGSLNSSDTIITGVKPFSGDPRSNFFKWLHGANASGGTPLRTALKDAGDYYSRDSGAEDHPWRTDTESKVDAEYLECRQSFTILMTDGYWNDDLSGMGDQDGKEGNSITGPSGRNYKYTPVDPFKADATNTLADVAMKYWKNDLQPNVTNRVPTSDENPAFWQHMRTYGVGLGVSGSIEPVDAFAASAGGTAISWPDPTAAGAAQSSKIDDLLHASVNSRGGFFSASDPTTFGKELGQTIGQITEAVGSASGITFDTATLEEDSLMFSARFDSRFWQGDLDARPLIFKPEDDEPSVGGAPVWSAADKLDEKDPDSRVIVTYDSSAGAGVPFLWDNLLASQKLDLSFGAATGEAEAAGKSRLAFLRGDRSKEGDGFRVRGSRLGDIVHSTPVRVASPSSGWPDTANFGEDTKRYSDFRAAKAKRTPVIYVGANDGMLHGFKATEDGGEELIAYVPGSVYSDKSSAGLHHLTSTGYSHQYYVDLSPLKQDVYTKGISTTGGLTTDRNWRTVLVGGLRAGGRGVFALDVTDPANFTEAKAGQLALWEFTPDASDSRKHLGRSIRPPQIALADWGTTKTDYRWTAFVANGYNADTDSTGYFMLDIEGGIGGSWVEGTNFKYIEFSTTGGGLSPLTAYDSDGDNIVDRVYAGDTVGRMWVAEKSNKGWGASYDTTSLFTAPAVGDPATRQAITAAPLVIANSGQKPASKEGPDTYVVFGTGKYLGFDDIGDTRQQAVYAVRDIGEGGRSVSDLAKRTLRSDVVSVDGTNYDVLLSEPDSTASATSDVKGWYVNLFEAGERVYLTPQVRGRYIFVTSIIPSTNPCIAGGESRPMAFGLDGLTPDKAVFRRIPHPVSSFKKMDGIANTPAFLGDFMFTPTSGGGDPDIEGIDVGNVFEDLGRQGWQELIAD